VSAALPATALITDFAYEVSVISPYSIEVTNSLPVANGGSLLTTHYRDCHPCSHTPQASGCHRNAHITVMLTQPFTYKLEMAINNLQEVLLIIQLAG
jgi:hypothetical protein